MGVARSDIASPPSFHDRFSSFFCFFFQSAKFIRSYDHTRGNIVLLSWQRSIDAIETLWNTRTIEQKQTKEQRNLYGQLKAVNLISHLEKKRRKCYVKFASQKKKKMACYRVLSKYCMYGRQSRVFLYHFYLLKYIMYKTSEESEM